MASEATRFDRCVRAFGESVSRRTAITSLLAGAAVWLHTGADADAKRRRSRTRKSGGNARRRDTSDLRQDAPPDNREAACPTGRNGCSGTCADLQTDSANCGSCGVACESGAVCRDGVCDGAPAAIGNACDVCPSGCAFSQLQPALDAAASGATIRVCPGEYQSNRSIFFIKNLTVVGAGADQTFIEGGGFVRVIDVSQGFDVTLRDLSIGGGAENRTLEDGGGGGGILIRPRGKLTLERCRVEDNTGRDGGGIAVGTNGTLSLIDSEVTDNATSTAGGGVWVGLDATVTMVGTHVRNNSSNVFGGGVLANGGRVTIGSGSSVAENSARFLGGGVYVAGGSTLNLETGSEVTRNAAGDQGGGVFSNGTTTIANASIVTNNQPTNCGGRATTNCVG